MFIMLALEALDPRDLAHRDLDCRVTISCICHGDLQPSLSGSSDDVILTKIISPINGHVRNIIPTILLYEAENI